MSPRALVLRAPGSNCDHESAFALEQAGAKAERVHINRFLSPGGPKLGDFDLAVIPGGFTFADDIAAGRILAGKLRLKLRASLEDFVAAGRPLVGICNGFQILLELGLLIPFASDGAPRADLSANDSGRFECRWTRLRVEAGCPSPYLKSLPDELSYPSAHAEGRLSLSEEALAELEGRGGVAFRYATPEPGSYPENPNGSVADIAGLCDGSGRILGLMPHPERALAARRRPQDRAAGLRFFENIVAAAGG